jgi:hypothetical protein
MKENRMHHVPADLPASVRLEQIDRIIAEIEANGDGSKVAAQLWRSERARLAESVGAFESTNCNSELAQSSITDDIAIGGRIS